MINTGSLKTICSVGGILAGSVGDGAVRRSRLRGMTLSTRRDVTRQFSSIFADALYVRCDLGVCVVPRVNLVSAVPSETDSVLGRSGREVHQEDSIRSFEPIVVHKGRWSESLSGGGYRTGTPDHSAAIPV
jgi:hypothetical protein